MQNWLRPFLGWMLLLAGWVLVLIGLGLFYLSLGLLLDRPSYFIQAAYPLVMGIFVFRGGIRLLRLGVAARIVLQAQSNHLLKPPTPVRRAKPEPMPANDW